MDLITFLRKEVKLTNRIKKSMLHEAGKSGDYELWTNSLILEGQVIAYEQILKILQNLSERDFQLAKKNKIL